MKRIVSHPEADQEWWSAAFFYAERNPEVAFDFNRRIREAQDQIAQDPERHPFVSRTRPVRKYRVERFPYSIIYRDFPDYVWIIAIAHGKRKPGYCRGRLKD